MVKESVNVFNPPLPFSYSGSTKSKTAPESKTATKSQPATAPWSGSSLTGCRRRAADRPEPLWRPVGEGEEDKSSPSKEDFKHSSSQPPQGDTSPPSPRTLEAIQAAMADSSDEETVGPGKKEGSVSPRTLLAIQEVLVEEDDSGAEQRNVSVNLQTTIHRPAPQVVIISSEEDDAKCVLTRIDSRENPTGRNPRVNDSLLVSSSEDEMKDVIGQSRKALHTAVLPQPQRKEMRSEEEMKDGELKEDATTGSGRQIETKDDLVQPHVAAASSQNTSSISLSAQRCGKPLSAETQPVLSEQRRNMSAETLEKRDEDDVKSEGSESEGKNQ